MKIINVLFAVVIIVALYAVFKPAKTDSPNGGEKTPRISFPGASRIPDSVFENTSASDTYYDVMNGEKKQIFWVYADCPIGRAMKKQIDAIIENNNLASNYLHNANLMSGGMMVFCKNRTNKCAQIYLYDNCSDKICVINPKQKAILKLNNSDFQKVAETLVKAKYW